MTSMQAVFLTRYGSPDYLAEGETAKPVPGDDDVLVKVRATSVNDWDWGLVTARPWVNRWMAGWTGPRKLTILGCDLAGVVEAVGRNITRFRPGDAVHGDICAGGSSSHGENHSFGALAEYICVKEWAINPMPVDMTFAEAAALPHAGMLMWQSLFCAGEIHAGQEILVNGAGGGVGTLAVQIGKLHGAEMTGVDAPHKLKRLLELGYDHVIDYTREDFTSMGKQYDLIVDVKTNRSAFAYPGALKPGGTYATCGGTLPRLFQVLSMGSLIGGLTGKRLSVVLLRPNRDMAALDDLVAQGKITPEIDRIFPLHEVREAFHRYGRSEQTGKIIITLEGP